jgi:hypothetical protein
LFTDTTTLFFARTSMATQLSKSNDDVRGAAVFNDENISRRAKIMYGVMLKYADVNGKFTINHETLMHDIGALTKKTVGVATKELADRGIIKRRRTSAAVHYTLLK